jgi:hypothetical protein
MPRSNGSSTSRPSSSRISISNIGSSRSNLNLPPRHTSFKTPVANTPVQTSQPQVVQSPGIGTSIKDGIASGFGWGIGTSIARSIFGGNSTPTPITEQPKATQPVSSNEQTNKCNIEQNEFFTCLKNNGSGMCFDFEEKLKKCMEK